PSPSRPVPADAEGHGSEDTADVRVHGLLAPGLPGDTDGTPTEAAPPRPALPGPGRPLRHGGSGGAGVAHPPGAGAGGDGRLRRVCRLEVVPGIAGVTAPRAGPGGDEASRRRQLRARARGRGSAARPRALAEADRDAPMTESRGPQTIR